MDGSRFDHLTRLWATRRTAIGGLVVGLAGLAGLDAEAKRNRKKQRKRKHTGDHADAEKKQHAAVLAEKKKKKKKKCKGGTVKCGKACVNASTDAQNCGGCGNLCGNGQACVGGACVSTGPVSCPTGQVRCGDLCVDTTSNENHCGGCGQTCQGELTCLSGSCGCADAGNIRCGTACANTLSDDDHCGGCGQACQGDLTCLNGACACASGAACGTTCVDTQTDTRHCGACGALCNAGQCVGGQCVQPPECSSDFDCGAGTGDLTCRNGRCVCKTDGEGICYRYAGAAGLAGECNPCCTGGNGICLRDHVCRNLGSFGGVPYPYCNCPAGTVTCNFGDSFRCSQDQATDPNRCGINCTDCMEEYGPTSFCCFGGCMTACEPNTSCNLRTCGGCQTCTGDTACCRSGTSNLFGCALLVNGQCPGPPE